jgi:ABC-type transport system involved in multi-copper enzyme maturation permease subunit
VAITRQFNAIVVDTVREARAQKVFLGMLMNGTLSALLVLWYVQTLASRAPSSRLTAMSRIDPRYLDNSFASTMVFSSAAEMLFWVQLLFAMTMTLGMLTPLMSPRRNTIAAAAPVPRGLILLGRYCGTICVASVAVGLAFLEVWIGICVKLGVWHARFLWGVAAALIAIASAVALMALFQSAVKSQAIVVVLLVGASLLNVGAQSPDRIREMTGSDLLARIADDLGSLMPRFAELAAWTKYFIATGDLSHSLVLCTSMLCTVLFVSGACLLFVRSEF